VGDNQRRGPSFFSQKKFSLVPPTMEVPAYVWGGHPCLWMYTPRYPHFVEVSNKAPSSQDFPTGSAPSEGELSLSFFAHTPPPKRPLVLLLGPNSRGGEKIPVPFDGR